MIKARVTNPIYSARPDKELRKVLADRTFDPKNIVRNIGIPVGITIASLPIAGCPRQNLPSESPLQPASLPQQEQAGQIPDYTFGRNLASQKRDINECYSMLKPSQCIQGYNDQVRGAAPAYTSVSTTVLTQQPQQVQASPQASGFNPYRISNPQSPESQSPVQQVSRLERWRERGSQAFSALRGLFDGAPAPAVDYTPIYQNELKITDPTVINALEAIRTSDFSDQDVALAESLNIPIADSGQEIIDNYINDVRALKQNGNTIETPYIEFKEDSRTGTGYCGTQPTTGYVVCKPQFDGDDPASEAALAILLSHELNHRRVEITPDGQKIHPVNSRFEEGRNFIVMGMEQDALKQNPRYSAAIQSADITSSASQVFALTTDYQQLFKQQDYTGFANKVSRAYNTEPAYDNKDPEQQKPSPFIDGR